MTFDLPPTGPENPPAFLTVVACQDWLATVPLANPGHAQTMFLRQLNLLFRHEMPVVLRFELLETLRETVIDTQNDQAKKFAGKPLPLAPPEQAAFDGTVAVWHALLSGYLRCLEAAIGGDAALSERTATVAERALAVFADWQVDLCRGQRLPDRAYWRQLQQAFVGIDGLGLVRAEVDDVVRRGNTRTTPLAVYCECHLLHIASPFELPQRHLNWIARWARRWGGKLEMGEEMPPLGGRSVPLLVDLASERPANHGGVDAVKPRWLDTGELRRSLKTRLVKLAEGEQPSRLQLGEDCTQPAAGQLLQRVYQRWCKGGAPRRHERKRASGGCEFIAGLEAVHYYLSGRKPFRPPSRDETLLRREREELATFGHRSTHQDEHHSGEQGYQVESWAVIDDWKLADVSAQGLKLSRPIKGGVRVGVGQMIAVKMGGSSAFITGNVRWALQDVDAEGLPTLSVGVQLFPGLPRAVALRGAEPGTREQYRQAFQLPELAALKEPATLVMTAGNFRIGRPMTLSVDGIESRVTLDHLVDRGAEFERCTYRAE